MRGLKGCRITWNEQISLEEEHGPTFERNNELDTVHREYQVPRENVLIQIHFSKNIN